MKSNSTRIKGVFLYDEPTLEKLKACTLFWKNVVVFESYLSDVVENADLVDITLTLIKNDVLKICQTPNGLRSAICDKIYYGLDRDLREYIYNHVEKIAVEPKLPEDAEQIIRDSTVRDCKDNDLQSLIDKTIRNGI